MLGAATEAQGPAFAASRLLLLPGLCSEELRSGKRSSYFLSSQLWCSNAVTIRLPINSRRCRLTSNKTVFGDRRHAFRACSAVSRGADEYPGTGPRCSPAHGSRVAGLPATQSNSNNLQLVTPIAPRLSPYAQEETRVPLQPEWEAPHAGPLPDTLFVTQDLDATSSPALSGSGGCQASRSLAVRQSRRTTSIAVGPYADQAERVLRTNSMSSAT